jgi:hypothetical protein
MGIFDGVKATIDANINSNGNENITGDILNNVLSYMTTATREAITEIKESHITLSEKEFEALTEKDADKYYYIYEE